MQNIFWWYRSKKPFNITYPDLIDLFKIEFIIYKKYIISVIDNLSTYTEVNFIFNKSNTSQVL